MKIYFSVCGLGLGHVGRCIPVARELERRGARILFSTYGDALGYLRREALPFVETPYLSYFVTPDGRVDLKATTAYPGAFSALLTLLRQVNAEISHIEALRPDLVFSDTRASPILAARILGVKRVVMLNQFNIVIPRRKRFLRLSRLADVSLTALIGRIWATSHRVLICDFPPPYTISKQNLVIPPSYRKRVSFTGPIVPVRPDELPDRLTLKEELGFDPDRPLILASISGPPREKAYPIRLLLDIFRRFPHDLQVVMSLGYPEKTSRLKEGPLQVFSWIPNRFEYLKACDLLVARAGHETVAQSMVFGRPSILVPTPGHTEQYGNARRAFSFGICDVIEQEELTLKRLLSSVRRILGNEKYQDSVNAIQKEVSRYNGYENVINAILELLGT